MIINRIKENKFYILYKRVIPKNTICPRYVIYRTDEFDGDLVKDFNYLSEAKRFFNKATKEAETYERILLNG